MRAIRRVAALKITLIAYFPLWLGLFQTHCEPFYMWIPVFFHISAVAVGHSLCNASVAELLCGRMQSATVKGPLHFCNITSREHESLALTGTQTTAAQRVLPSAGVIGPIPSALSSAEALKAREECVISDVILQIHTVLCARHQKHLHKFLKSNFSNKSMFAFKWV